MQSSDHDRLYSLCAYGMSETSSSILMKKYGQEDNIPLNEFDATEYRRTEGL